MAIRMVCKKKLLNRFAARLAWLGDTAKDIIFGGEKKSHSITQQGRGKPGKVHSVLTMKNKTIRTNLVPLSYWVSFV